MSDININAVYTQLRDAQILVTIYLMNGFQLHGVIVAFDQEVVAIKSDSRILIVINTPSLRLSQKRLLSSAN